MKKKDAARCFDAAAELFLPEKKVKDFLARLPSVRGKLILAAVSGGSDSMALLEILRRLSPVLRFNLSIITVDHGLRTREESSGDARFVKEYCLAANIPCSVAEIPRGAITAARACGGVEAAARQARYERFEAEARAIRADYIALGHNRGDHLETALMQFFQGSAEAVGIQAARGRYIRPLLELDKSALEEYLVGRGVPFRVDSTNADFTYLRNRIRGRLVPLLDEILPGWKNAVAAGTFKARWDNDFLAASANIPAAGYGSAPADKRRFSVSARNTLGGGRDYPLVIAFSGALFFERPPAVRLRMLLRGFNALGYGARIPFKFLRRIVERLETEKYIRGSGLCAEAGRAGVFLCGDIVLASESRYLIYVYAPTRIDTAFFSLIVKTPGGYTDAEGACFIDLAADELPFTVRPLRAGDYIFDGNGKKRLCRDILAAAGVPRMLRDHIPAVECAGRIALIAGSAFGFSNWFGFPPPGAEPSRRVTTAELLFISRRRDIYD